MSSLTSLLNCLICGKGLEEEKPLVSVENVEIFKRSFHCFCRLLNLSSEDNNVVREEIIDGVISALAAGCSPSSSSQVAFGLPCCSDCFRALSELDRLQQSIEQLRTTQTAHMEELKHSFQSSSHTFLDQDVPGFKSWTQLVACIQKHLASNFVEITTNHNEGDPDSMELGVSPPSLRDPLGEEEEQKCEEDETFDEMPVSSSPHPHCPSSPTSLSSNCVEEEAGQTPAKKRSKPTTNNSPGKKRLTKKRCLENSDQESPSTLRRSFRQRRPPAVWNSEDQLFISEGGDADSAEDFVPSAGSEGEEDDLYSEREDAGRKRKAVPKRKPAEDLKRKSAAPPPTSGVKRKRRGTKKLNSLLYRITDDTLLYKFTLVQVSPCRTQLKCLEPGCSAMFQDLSSLHLFEKMSAHVDRHHFPKEGVPSSIKLCPFMDCKAEFPKVDPFRSHLLDHHKCMTVLGEICWRPFMDRRNLLMTHKWFHRSDQEKLEVPTPKMVLNQIKRLKNSKHKWLLEVESEKAEAVPTPPRLKVTKNELFSKLSEALLLYKFTVIKLIPGKGFSCEEPGCTVGLVANGTDYQAFEMVKAHIEKAHLEGNGGKLGYSRKVRKCPLCLVTSGQDGDFSGQSIREHLFTDHHGTPPPFLCHCCWRPLATERHMRSHLLTHQSVEDKTASGMQETPSPQQTENVKKTRKFVCEECGRRFEIVANYRKHKQTHLAKEEREMLSCDQCPKTFTTGHTLRFHMEKFHIAPEQIQLLTCTICNKQYLWRERERFETHVRSHSNEKPYVCDICGASFAGGDNLRKHIKSVHTDGKRHQCQFCEMNYKRANVLRHHQLKKHGDRVAPPDAARSSVRSTPLESRAGFIGPKIAFPCEICEKVLPLKCRLTQHLKKYHPEVI